MSSTDTTTPEETFLFTSESVGEGHPDKCCDQISDAVLDACLAADPSSKVACETAAKSNHVLLFGEITTTATVDLEQVVRTTLKKIGYDDAAKGIDAATCRVDVSHCKRCARVWNGKADACIRKKAMNESSCHVYHNYCAWCICVCMANSDIQKLPLLTHTYKLKTHTNAGW